MRIATYLRISKNETRSTSIEKQRANVARLIADRYPRADVTEFVDRGVSASKKRSRPQFEALTSRLAEFDVVIFDTQDRVARRPLDFWTFAAAAEAAGTAINGASEDLDLSTAEGELTAGLRLTVARHEARKTGTRVEATNEHRRSQGLRALGGPPVWGLMRAGEGFAPDPTRAPILLDAIDRVIGGELSIRGTAEEFTRRGIPTARGHAEWSHRAASKVLRSPALAGMTPYTEKKPDGSIEHDVIRGDDGMPTVLPGDHLLTVDRWHQLQAALNARVDSRAPVRRKQPLPLLHRLARDEEGHPLYRHAPAGRVVRYNCRAVGCSTKTSVGLEALDSYVVGTFLATVGEEEEMRAEVVIHGRDVARLNAVRAEIRKTASALAACRDPEEIGDLALRLSAQRRAEAELETGAAHGDVYGFTPTGRTIGDAFHAAANDAERAAVLAEHIEVVVVRPTVRGGGGRPLADRVEIRWIT
jgi:site-specific DNA recombinase